MTKIAFIPSTFLPHVGGAETQTHNVANNLQQKKIEVDVYVLNKNLIKNANYKIIKLNKYLINFIFILKYYFNINFDFLIKSYFNKIQNKKKYDLWHFHSVNYKTLIYKYLNSKLMQYYRIVLCLVFCLCLFKGYSQSSSIQDSIDLYSLNEPKKAIPFLKDLVEIQKNEKNGISMF